MRMLDPSGDVSTTAGLESRVEVVRMRIELVMMDLAG
jgi:hypothetical protein